MTKKMLTNTHM